jgi:IclR family transcriptional regulator, pca regulon regulatory protein
LRSPPFLERSLAILECFSDEYPAFAIADLADELGTIESTITRHLCALVALGYLELDHSGAYRLTSNGFGSPGLSATSMRERAHSHVEDLRILSSHTVSLGALEGAEIVFIDRERSLGVGQGSAGLDLRPGSRLPAHRTAMGKVLLAYLPARARSRALDDLRMEKGAPNTLTNKGVLRSELKQIRADGFAVNDQELMPEHHSIAVPVRARSQAVVAALSMSSHRSIISLEEMVANLMPHLVTTAGRISASLGFRR